MGVTAPTAYAFVPAGDLGRPKLSDRKLIRSHCMQGRNRKRRADRPTNKPLFSGHEACGSTRGVYGCHCMVSAEYCSLCNVSQGNAKDETGAELVIAALHHARETISIPPPPPPALSLIKLAGRVGEHSRELLFKHFTAARTIFYPLGLCLRQDPSWNVWLGWLEEDVAYLHSALMGTSAMQDFVLQRPPAKTTLYHNQKTIAFLNDHLSDSGFALRDSTVAIILGLALGAQVNQDTAAACAHASGLRKIIYLRGGLDTFRGNAKLHVKLRILDIFRSLSTGQRPWYLAEEAGSVPQLRNTYLFPDSIADEASCCTQPIAGLGSHELADVLRQLQAFVNVLNTAARDPQQRLLDNDFQNLYCSLQYRLLQLEGRLDSPTDEYLRLAMLAFQTTMHQIPGKRVVYPHLGKCLRTSYNAIDTSNPVLQDLLIWALITGFMSVWNADESWARGLWLIDVPGLTWAELRPRLKNILWIDAIHDDLGRRAFETLSK